MAWVRRYSPAVLALGAIVVLNGAYDVALHRTSLTPERLVVTAIASMLLLPFFISFEVMLRRGSLALSTLTGFLGRAVIVAAFAIGLQTGAVPFVVGLVIRDPVRDVRGLRRVGLQRVGQPADDRGGRVDVAGAHALAGLADHTQVLTGLFNPASYDCSVASVSASAG
jgi:hypothetical protein